MEIRPLAVPDSYVLDLVPHGDPRGRVTEWYRGTNIISIMPLTTKSSGDHAPGFNPAVAPAPGHGYAWWSGTSFAAATVAGNLAARLPGGQALPESAAGS